MPNPEDRKDRDDSWAIIMLEGIVNRYRKDENVNTPAFEHLKAARDILKSVQNNPKK
jgi:hypothetical protein